MQAGLPSTSLISLETAQAIGLLPLEEFIERTRSLSDDELYHVVDMLETEGDQSWPEKFYRVYEAGRSLHFRVLDRLITRSLEGDLPEFGRRLVRLALETMSADEIAECRNLRVFQEDFFPFFFGSHVHCPTPGHRLASTFVTTFWMRVFVDLLLPLAPSHWLCRPSSAGILCAVASASAMTSLSPRSLLTGEPVSDTRTDLTVPTHRLAPIPRRRVYLLACQTAVVRSLERAILARVELGRQKTRGGWGMGELSLIESVLDASAARVAEAINSGLLGDMNRRWPSALCIHDTPHSDGPSCEGLELSPALELLLCACSLTDVKHTLARAKMAVQAQPPASLTLPGLRLPPGDVVEQCLHTYSLLNGVGLSQSLREACFGILADPIQWSSAASELTLAVALMVAETIPLLLNCEAQPHFALASVTTTGLFSLVATIAATSKTLPWRWSDLVTLSSLYPQPVAGALLLQCFASDERSDACLVWSGLRRSHDLMHDAGRPVAVSTPTPPVEFHLPVGVSISLLLTPLAVAWKALAQHLRTATLSSLARSTVLSLKMALRSLNALAALSLTAMECDALRGIPPVSAAQRLALAQTAGLLMQTEGACDPLGGAMKFSPHGVGEATNWSRLRADRRFGSDDAAERPSDPSIERALLTVVTAVQTGKATPPLPGANMSLPVSVRQDGICVRVSVLLSVNGVEPPTNLTVLLAPLSWLGTEDDSSAGAAGNESNKDVGMLAEALASCIPGLNVRQVEAEAHQRDRVTAQDAGGAMIRHGSQVRLLPVISKWLALFDADDDDEDDLSEISDGSDATGEGLTLDFNMFHPDRMESPGHGYEEEEDSSLTQSTSVSMGSEHETDSDGWGEPDEDDDDDERLGLGVIRRYPAVPPSGRSASAADAEDDVVVSSSEAADSAGSEDEDEDEESAGDEHAGEAIGDDHGSGSAPAEARASSASGGDDDHSSSLSSFSVPSDASSGFLEARLALRRGTRLPTPPESPRSSALEENKDADAPEEEKEDEAPWLKRGADASQLPIRSGGGWMPVSDLDTEAVALRSPESVQVLAPSAPHECTSSTIELLDTSAPVAPPALALARALTASIAMVDGHFHRAQLGGGHLVGAANRLDSVVARVSAALASQRRGRGCRIKIFRVGDPVPFPALRDVAPRSTAMAGAVALVEQLPDREAFRLTSLESVTASPMWPLEVQTARQDEMINTLRTANALAVRTPPLSRPEFVFEGERGTGAGPVREGSVALGRLLFASVTSSLSDAGSQFGKAMSEGRNAECITYPTLHPFGGSMWVNDFGSDPECLHLARVPLWRVSVPRGSSPQAVTERSEQDAAERHAPAETAQAASAGGVGAEGPGSDAAKPADDGDCSARHSPTWLYPHASAVNRPLPASARAHDSTGEQWTTAVDALAVQARIALYWSAGRALGVALHSGNPMGVVLPRYLVKCLLAPSPWIAHVSLGPDDVAEVDPRLAASLRALLDRGQVSDEEFWELLEDGEFLRAAWGPVELYFDDKTERQELRPAVARIPVPLPGEGVATTELRRAVVAAQCAWLLLGGRGQFVEALRFGLEESIGGAGLAGLAVDDAVAMWAGTREVDTALWKSLTEISDADAELGELFWRGVEALDASLLQPLLVMWSGSPSLSPRHRFYLERNDSSSLLPTIGTCGRSLSIPHRWKTVEDVVRGLSIAIRVGAEGYGDA